MLSGLRLARLRVMKRQNSSISTTRSTARRTASAFVWTPSTRRARRIAPSSTKKERRVNRAEGCLEIRLIGISYAPNRHTSTAPPLDYCSGASRRAARPVPISSNGSIDVGHDGIVVSMWFVYIIPCADDSLYVGETNDLDLPQLRHGQGRAAAFTARCRPIVLAYLEQYPTRKAALMRERQLKRWTRAKKDALIPGNVLLLKKLESR